MITNYFGTLYGRTQTILHDSGRPKRRKFGITNIDDSAVEIIEDENEDNKLENVLEENINLEQLPWEILQRIFLSTLVLSDYPFLNHVCWTVNNIITVVQVFRLFENKGMDHLPKYTQKILLRYQNNKIQGKYSLRWRES